MKHFAFYKQEANGIAQLQMNTNFPHKKIKNTMNKINNNLKKELQGQNLELRIKLQTQRS